MSARLATIVWQGVRHLILPGVCLGCHRILPPDASDFCANCLQQFTDDPHSTCPRCSSTVGPHADVSDGCPRCRDEGFAFGRAVRLGPYEGLLRDFVLRMKHSGNEGLAEAVGEAWVARSEAKVREFGADIVVPVPLHWRRRWRRGFNQSELLAQCWSRRLSVPIQTRWLRRVRPTAMQSSLSPTARRENVRSAFRATRRAKLHGRRVLLVDDVLTTGSTAHAAAAALKNSGASSVAVVVLAHGH
jgi:ComF family protein